MNISWCSLLVDISRYQASCCKRNHQYRLEDWFHEIEQEKITIKMTESQNPYLNQKSGPPFRVIGEAQFLCFVWNSSVTPGYISEAGPTVTDGPTRDEMKTNIPSFALFLLSLKQAAETHPCPRVKLMVDKEFLLQQTIFGTLCFFTQILCFHGFLWYLSRNWRLREHIRVKTKNCVPEWVACCNKQFEKRCLDAIIEKRIWNRFTSLASATEK